MSPRSGTGAADPPALRPVERAAALRSGTGAPGHALCCPHSAYVGQGISPDAAAVLLAGVRAGVLRGRREEP